MGRGSGPAPCPRHIHPALAHHRNGNTQDNHQDFAARHPDCPYIVVNDAPKLAALRRLFPELQAGDPRKR